MTGSVPPPQAFPHIMQELADQRGKLPETVVEWISPLYATLDHAKHLDEALAWGATVTRFPSVRRQLRRDESFWQAYAQLRLAWWLSELGIVVLEFEPNTIGEKRADIRCRLADAEVDLEVFSPIGSTSVRQDIELPRERLINALKAADVLGVDITLINHPQASYRAITEEKAAQVASTVAQLVQSGFSDSDDGVILEFDELTITHSSTLDVPSLLIPEDEPFRIRVTKRSDDGASLFHGRDVMAYLRRDRPGLPQDDGTIDWLTSTLREKAEQLDPDRVSGIWIEGTHDDDLYSQLMVPWGVPAILDRFWGSAESSRIDFVGLFEVAPGHSYLLPGVRGLGGLHLNPSGQVMASPSLHKAIEELWESWNERVVGQLAT